MVLLSLFLLAGIDRALNPKSRQTIGKRVRLGLADDEYDRLTRPIGLDKKSGLSVRKRKKNDFTF